MNNFDILSLLPTRPTINIVDVGAMFLGQANTPYARLMQTATTRIVGFEPVPEECDKLNAVVHQNCKYLPYAIGDGSKRTFNICNYPMTSSLYEPNMALAEKFQQLAELMQVVSRVEMQTHRLDDIKEVTDTDYLKLDVQGAELDVLRGAAHVLADAVVVHTEVEFVPIYKDQPLFAEIDQELRRQGYAFHKFAGIAGRTFKPLMVKDEINTPRSQQLWADVVYARDFMALDRLSPEKLLKLAVILHIQYGSADLAMEAFKAYDAKTGAGLTDQYLRGLFSNP